MSGIQSAIHYLQENWLLLLYRVGVAALILALTFLAAGFIADRVEALLRRRSPRSATLASVARGGVKLVVFGVGVVMALDQLGIDIKAILAGAGIIGLAVGFGAQSLVKDLISGFFLIFDDALAEGDIANVGGQATGVIEAVGLRMTKVRSFDGQLWYIQNGQIDRVGNFSREWTRAVVEVGLAYEQDVAQGLRVLQQVGDEWAAAHRDLVLEPPEAQGVLGLNASDVGVRLIVKVTAGNHWAAERELRKLAKAAFDRAGVEIPFPRQVVYHRQEPDAALAVRSQAPARPASSRATPPPLPRGDA